MSDFIKEKDNRQPVRRADGRIVGHIIGNVFYKKLRASVHMMRSPRGWASDESILIELKRLGVEFIQILDKETGISYSACINEFWRYGVEKLYSPHNPQICLPIKYWQTWGAGVPRQLNLFT